MSHHLTKKSILKKTVLVSSLTLLSRILGVFREFLMARFLGVGAISDAFVASFKLPNFFRHIFAEGALGASFVPAIVKTVKEGNREEANGLMTISFLFFEGIVLLMYVFVILHTNWVLLLLAPGFSADQIAYAIPFTRILFSFLFFISSSALLAGALNSVNHFFVPAFGTPLWNMFFIATLIICLAYKLPATYMCLGIIIGAFAFFLMHLITFFKYNFTFGSITPGARAAFKSVLSKFLPCLFGVSIVELNMFISGSIASFLPKGSMTLLYYGGRFMNIPLGMFAVALASVLLSHFSRLVLYAPRRLSFYLLEVAKLVTWAILPAALFLMFVSHELFIFLLGNKVTPEQSAQGAWILILYCTGLLFLCLNKILLSMFYALKDTWSTTLAAGLCAAVNISLDILSLFYFGAYGIAMSNTISSLCMSILALILLRKRHHITFFLKRYLRFLWRYLLNLIIAIALFLLGFMLIRTIFVWWGMPMCVLHGIGYWLVMSMLVTGTVLFMFFTRRLFGIEVYFLKK